MNQLHMGSGGGVGLGANFPPSAHQHQSSGSMPLAAAASAMSGVMGTAAAASANMPPSTLGVTIRLHGLPLTASSADIRKFFSGLNIPDGGVHIIGGDNGEAFITFSSDEDGRLAMLNNNKDLSGSKVSLFLSSKTEMQAKIDELRSGAALMSQEPAYGNAYPVQASQFFSQQQNLGPVSGSANNRYSVLGDTPQHSSFNNPNNAYETPLLQQGPAQNQQQFQFNPNMRPRIPSQQMNRARTSTPAYNRAPIMERSTNNFMDQQRPQRPSNSFNPMRGTASRNPVPVDQNWQNTSFNDVKNSSTPDALNSGPGPQNSFKSKADQLFIAPGASANGRGVVRNSDSRPPFRQPAIRVPFEAQKALNPRFNASATSRNVRPGAFDMVRGSSRPGAPFQRGMTPPTLPSGQMEHSQNSFNRPLRSRFPNANANNSEFDQFNAPDDSKSATPVEPVLPNQPNNQRFPSNAMNSGGSLNASGLDFLSQLQSKDGRVPIPPRNSDTANNYGSFMENDSDFNKPNFDQFRNSALLLGEANVPAFSKPSLQMTNASGPQEFTAPKLENDRGLTEVKDRKPFEHSEMELRNKSQSSYLFPGEGRGSPSLDEDRRHRKRSTSREKQFAVNDNKRLHIDENTSSSSNKLENFKNQSFFYVVIDHAPLDVKDSDIREFLSDANCKSNMRPIILARKSYCLIFLRFDDEKLSKKCLQLSGRRFKSDLVKISESNKKSFDEAYVEFQCEINREIHFSLKSNNYKGDFIRVEGLPDNVTNDQIMNDVFGGEKLQVDDIYIEYSPYSTLDEPYVGYVRTSCRRDAERLCQSNNKQLEGRTLKVTKIAESQFYQSIKDHQARNSITSSRTDTKRGSTADADCENRESRRRSVARMTESVERTRSRDRDRESHKDREREKEREKEIKTKQCPDDVCVELLDLPSKIEKKEIREFFKKLKVMHVVFDPDDERKAYVEFEKEREQVVALRMNRQKLADSSVKIMAIESSEYLKKYLKYKGGQTNSETKNTSEKSCDLSAENLDFSRSSKRSAYPKQFYKILFRKPLCTSLDVLRRFLEVTFESHIVLKKDQGGFTTEAYLTTCENPPSHFMSLEGKLFCSVGVIVCKVSEEDFKKGTNSIQPAMFSTQIVKAEGPLNDQDLQKVVIEPSTESGSADSGVSTSDPDDKTLDNSMIKINGLPLRVATSDVEKFLAGIRIRANGIALFSDKREAIVILENASARAKALKLNNSTFNGCQVQIVSCFIPEAMSRFPLAQFRPIAIFDMEPVTDKHIIALISGIPKGCEAKQLQELLKPCKIASVTFMRAVSTAFVQMQSSADAQLCQLKNGYSIGQCSVNVTVKTKVDMDKMIAEFKRKGSTGTMASQATPPAPAPSGTQSSLQSSRSEHVSNSTTSQSMLSSASATGVKEGKTPPFSPKIDVSVQPHFAVHLTNLPPTVIKKDIIQLFCHLMLDEKRIVLRSPNEKRDTSEAVVLLSTMNECKAAHELNQTFLGPRKIVVRILERTEIMPIIASYGNLTSPYQVPPPSNLSFGNTSGFDPITLRLSGLPIDVSARDILDFFKDYNPNPELLAISNDSITRACTAQLSFNNRTLGMQAMENKQGQFLGGRRILITIPSAS